MGEGIINCLQKKALTQIMLTLELLNQDLNLGIIPASIRAEAVVYQVGKGLAKRLETNAQVLKEQAEHLVHVNAIRLLQLDLPQRLRIQVLVVVDKQVDGLVVNAQLDQAVDHALSRLYHALAVAALLGRGQVLAQDADQLRLLLLVDQLLVVAAARLRL